MSPFNEKSFLTAPSFGMKIWMAGDYTHAKQILRNHCAEIPACYSITEFDYIYSGGEEAGFMVCLINYPRFPSTESKLVDTCSNVAALLMDELGQGSYTTEMYGMENNASVFTTRRKSDG